VQKAFFILLFLLSTASGFGQRKVPVFASKKDSADFEKINQQLMDIRQFDAPRLDSLMTANQRLLKQAIRFRTIYGPSRGFDLYRLLPDDLGTVTKLSLSDYKGKRLPDSI
jgi:hypothetical protein